MLKAIMASSSRRMSRHVYDVATRGSVGRHVALILRPMSIIGYFRPPAAIDVDEVSREKHFEDKTKHNAMLEVYRDDNEDWDEFEDRAESFGSDQNIGFRKEHRKRREVTYETPGRRGSKRSIRKVNALVSFLEYKRGHRYR